MLKKEKTMEFKEKVIYIRAKLNLSQTDLAKILNVSYVTCLLYTSRCV